MKWIRFAHQDREHFKTLNAEAKMKIMELTLSRHQGSVDPDG
jgi:hypothetical protein